jgi:hypothetical protein
MLFGYGTSVPAGRFALNGVEVTGDALGDSVGRDVDWAVSVDAAIASCVGRAIGLVRPQARRASDRRTRIHFLMNDACFDLNILMG